MSYKVRDGRLYVQSIMSLPEYDMGSVDEAVADALDVLRAAGWSLEHAYGEFGPDVVPGRAPFGKRTVARSPWRKVDGADDGE